MPNFIYDDTALTASKSDLVAVPVGADPDKYVDAADWNLQRAALLDIQTVLRGATWTGLGQNVADPAPAGLTDYLWLDAANVLWLHTGGGDVDLTAGVGALVDADFAAADGWMRKTGAGAYEAIKANMGAAVAPVVTDDSAAGYAIGSRWFDTTADKEYVCLDASAGAAVWIETTGSAGGGTDLTGLGVDNRLARWDGANTLQVSLWSEADTGVMTAGGALWMNASALLLDADNDTGFVVNGDDDVTFKIANTDLIHFVGGIGGVATFLLAGMADVIGTVFEAENATAATDPIKRQNSPAIAWVGQAWEALSAASEEIRFGAFVDAVDVASGDVEGLWSLYCQRSSGGVNTIFTVDQSGNVALSGTVDGRDVAADGTVLDTAILDADFAAADGFLRKTGAGAYEAIKANMGAAVAPVVTDDSAAGYAIGSRWLDTTADKEYVCLDASAGAAVWIETTQSGGTDLTGLGTDNQIARWNGTDTLQGSNVTISDTGVLTVVAGTSAAPSIVVGAAGTGLFDATASRLGAVSAGLLRAMFGAANTFYGTAQPNVTAAHNLGALGNRWKTGYSSGIALAYEVSGAASFVADGADHGIVLTAATAELVLPSIATVGVGFELLVVFTGATSLTITPNGADTVAHAPVQNEPFFLIAVTGGTWSAFKLAGYTA